MNGSRAALRYAKAVIQNSKEDNTSDLVFGDMQSVKDTIEGSKELRLMLQSPIIKTNDKREALLAIFKNQSETIKKLINLLVDNKRAHLLGDVAASYVHLHNEAKGVKTAKVTTAVPLSETLEEKVLAKVKELTGSNSVTLENTVDPSIIGGFVLRVGDLQYDASIANKLDNLKREFSKVN